MKNILLLLSVCLLISCKQKKDTRTTYFPKSVEMVEKIPDKENLWVFLLAGQSNMAGRGLVEPTDTISDKRIFTINSTGQLIYAKEPLHLYEPALTGLDCGLSFGKTLIQSIPDSISILLIPTAVGGSSVSQWLNDSVHRNVKLLSNFIEKVETGKKYGTIKAILWHQGESDANEKDIPEYQTRLSKLFQLFRTSTGNDSLPILLGELGSYSKDKENWRRLNKIINDYSLQDNNTAVISTSDLKDKGDTLHFNSVGQRILGQRFAEAYNKKFK